MDILRGACVIGQSGGPTAVINSSVCGAVVTALKSPFITNVYGAENGIQGILEDRLFDFGKEDDLEISLLTSTPASALGSCRYKLKDSDVDETDYKRILEIFKKYDIRYFFYNGGNDSMDTCNKVSKYMQKVGYDCRIIGIPKTVDNDLAGTDHCPGFGSAAKYIATSIAEVSVDSKVYTNGSVIIFELMGRHAGWLTGAAALAGLIGEGPDLIYLPERTFDLDRFIADVERLWNEKGNVIVAVSEGIKDASGKFISEYGSDLADTKDAFGHSQLGGLANTLVNILKSRTNIPKLRGIELSLLQRCAAHSASATDINEAYMAGEAAVNAAVNGVTDVMIGFKRAEGPEYRCETIEVPLHVTANAENTVPESWVNEDGNYVTQEFIDYALPLIQGDSRRILVNGMPRYSHLKKFRVQ